MPAVQPRFRRETDVILTKLIKRYAKKKNYASQILSYKISNFCE
jgi:hypothetical protein